LNRLNAGPVSGGSAVFFTVVIPFGQTIVVTDALLPIFRPKVDVLPPVRVFSLRLNSAS